MKNLLKDYKWQTILSCLAVLSPILPGLMHFGTLSIWGIISLPIFCAVMQLLCLAITFRDPGNQNQNKKAMGMIFWILPVISMGSSAAIYRAAEGKPVDTSLVVVIISFTFIFIGNYLPKLRRNSTMGIKLPWTLCNEENWNKTHRFGGKVWVICGLSMFLSLLLPEKYFLIPLLAIVILAVAIPTVYSYRLYRRQDHSGEVPVEIQKNTKAGLIAGAVILILCTVLLFTGNVKISLGDDSLTASATYYPPITIDYGKIDDAAFLENAPMGSRTFGFGSPRLALGQYRNEAFGDYISYRYNTVNAAVVIHCGDTTYVLNAQDAPATRALYENLRAVLAG